MIFILWYSERTGRCILYCRSVVKLKISSAQQDTCEKIEIAHVIAALSLNAERPGWSGAADVAVANRTAGRALRVACAAGHALEPSSDIQR